MSSGYRTYATAHRVPVDEDNAGHTPRDGIAFGSRQGHIYIYIYWDRKTYANDIDGVFTSDQLLSEITLMYATVAQRYPCNLLTRWDVSSITANGNFLTKKIKTKTKNAQRVEND